MKKMLIEIGWKNSLQIMSSDDSSLSSFERQIEEGTNQADLQLFINRRKEELQQEFKEQQLILNNQHGQLLEVAESVFLDHMAKSTMSVAHFYLPDFKMCRMLNEMLEKLAKEHVETKFVKINAEEATWFVNKFKIQTLPSIIVCVNGQIVKKFIGMEEFGNEYPNERDLKIALSKIGAIRLKEGELNQVRSIFGYVEKELVDRGDDDDF